MGGTPTPNRVTGQPKPKRPLSCPFPFLFSLSLSLYIFLGLCPLFLLTPRTGSHRSPLPASINACESERLYPLWSMIDGGALLDLDPLWSVLCGKTETTSKKEKRITTFHIAIEQ